MLSPRRSTQAQQEWPSGAPSRWATFAFGWSSTARAIRPTTGAGGTTFLLVLEGELHTELADGRLVKLTAGMSYQVANDISAHRSRTQIGAKLVIVD